MTDRRKDQEKVMDRLLTDDEFADLMLASYIEAGKPVDELAKRRVWAGLSTQIAAQARRSVLPQHFWAPFVAVALVLFAIVTAPQSGQDTMRIKGAEGIPIDLFAYSLSASGNTEAAPDVLTEGLTLVFKYRLAEPGTVALISSENGGPPQVKFISTEGHPGVEQLLVRDGRTYGYSVESGVESLRVCLLAAAETAALEESLQELALLWPKLGTAACRSWETFGDKP